MNIFSPRNKVPPEPQTDFIQKPLNPDFSYSIALQHALFGKLLLRDELPFAKSLIQSHIENGCIQIEYGIKTENNRPYCLRCGNQTARRFASFRCYRCQKDCLYCRNCMMLGRISACTPLFRWIGPAIEKQVYPDALVWSGSLSAWQRHASVNVTEAIKEEGTLLVWAVCGAGKTEMLFHGIAAALAKGQSVCIATPRTDVVLELAPRFKKVFPSIDVAALYGGSKDLKRPTIPPVTITTTHQLLRYEHAFDVMILDEADAFPYSVDASLQYAASRARKKDSALIYLTATPSKTMKKQAATGKLASVRIARRFHGHPLPVPEFRWCGNWKKPLGRGNLPSNVQRWLMQKQSEQRQLFLFVPSIDVMEQVTAIVSQFFSYCTSIHAQDNERVQKMQEFRAGKLQLLITTTILERGVTIPKLDVAVLGSEADIFTESALVQIAGRAGRSADAPTGDVIFFHYGKTNAMVDARKHIQMMNEEGEKMDGSLPRL